jgi:hypothetical protein
MSVVLGPYPLCPRCQQTNGGLIAVRHRQVHLRAHGKEACVDRGLAGLLTNLWAVCDTRSCCENDRGRAYVVPTADTCGAAAQLLTQLGLRPSLVDGIIYFQTPTSFRLDDADQVRRVLEQPGGTKLRWRVNESGTFVTVRPIDESDSRDAGT